MHAEGDRLLVAGPRPIPHAAQRRANQPRAPFARVGCIRGLDPRLGRRTTPFAASASVRNARFTDAASGKTAERSASIRTTFDPATALLRYFPLTPPLSSERSYSGLRSSRFLLGDAFLILLRCSHRRTNSKPAYEVRPARSYRKISGPLTRARNSAFGRRTEVGLSLGVDSVAWCSASTTPEGPFCFCAAQLVDVFVTSRLEPVVLGDRLRQEGAASSETDFPAASRCLTHQIGDPPRDFRPKTLRRVRRWFRFEYPT